MTNAGHHFRPNGDLELSFDREKWGLLLHLVYGFRGGEKVLVDSWCEPRCHHCGCPRERYHAQRCPLNEEDTDRA